MWHQSMCRACCEWYVDAQCANFCIEITLRRHLNFSDVEVAPWSGFEDQSCGDVKMRSQWSSSQR